MALRDLLSPAARLPPALLVSLALLPATVPGCVSDCPANCPSELIDRHDASADDGQLTWTLDQTVQSFPYAPSVDDAHPAQTCFALVAGGTKSVSPFSQGPGLELALEMGCSGADGSLDGFDLQVQLDDIRSLASGSVVTALQATGAYGDSAGGPCMFSLALDEVHLFIDAAAGGAADFPALVTPDFARTFRVEVKMQAPVFGVVDGQPEGCDRALKIEGSAGFTLKASDYHGALDAPCSCPR